jgi:DNA polymerase-3 subunit delta
MAKSTAAKSGSLTGLDYLTKPDKHPVAAVCAVFGDEAYLKFEVLAALRRQVLGAEEGEFSLTTVAGPSTQLREVLDALATVSLFGGGRRLVIVEDADSFVTQYRGELEDYVTRPAKESVLALDVQTWPGNTRLAKAVAACGLSIDCKSPNERQVKSWLTKRAKTTHDVQLDTAAADAILELLPPELGILAQELDKLALLVGDGRTIDTKLVRENVGGWRTRAVWDMVDAVADGRAVEALGQLDRLIAAGEKPFGLLPQMASSLRKFDTATRLVEAAEADRRPLPLREALSQTGLPPFKLSDAERQLRRIGRQRAKQLTSWLLAVDLAIKGHNSADDRARTEIERLIVRLSAGNPVGPPSRGGPVSAARLAAPTSLLPAS